MKILYAVSECWPFAKTGGLADVAASLPSFLKKMGVDISVVMPCYGDISYYYDSKEKEVANFKVDVAWRKQNCAIKKITYNDIDYYFVDNEFYFKREGLYDHLDDAERFTFFSRAILEMLPYLDFKPDIIHCNDWHTALVSLFLKTKYIDDQFFKDIKTVLTIHNLKYQGIFPGHVIEDVLGFSRNFFIREKLNYFGDVNFIKLGVTYTDMILTTSKSFAQKITTPKFGGELSELFKKRAESIYGITNGVDKNIFNPGDDPHIFQKYNRKLKDLENKQANKLKLQKLLDLHVSWETPLLVIVSNLVKHKGFSLVLETLPELLKERVELVVLGVGEERYEHDFKVAAWENPNQVSTHITYNEDLARKFYAAGDFFLQPSRSEPSGTSPLIALQYLTVPIIRRTGGLEDYIIGFNQDPEKGNGFVFSNFAPGEFSRTIQNALACYRNKKKWNKLIENVTEYDYDWRNSAREHLKIYNKVKNKQ